MEIIIRVAFMMVLQPHLLAAFLHPVRNAANSSCCYSIGSFRPIQQKRRERANICCYSIGSFRPIQQKRRERAKICCYSIGVPSLGAEHLVVTCSTSHGVNAKIIVSCFPQPCSYMSGWSRTP